MLRHLGHTMENATSEARAFQFPRPKARQISKQRGQATATDLSRFCGLPQCYLSRDELGVPPSPPFAYASPPPLLRSPPPYLLDMRWSAALVLPFLPLSVLAGKFHDPALRSRHARHAIQARTNSTKFTMADYYQGESFLKCVKS